MTRPPPNRPPADRQFARDVARQIDHRRVRRRLTLWSALLALVSAAALWLRCGGGLGMLGIGGAGAGEGGPATLATPTRCEIHVSTTGITIGGKTMSRDAAVDACKSAPGVDIWPTGDVLHGDVEGLQAAFEAAGVRPDVRPPPRAAPATTAPSPKTPPAAPATTAPSPAAPPRR
jgi:hypothetical protein